ncbi:GntP family permease [Methanolobus sp. ZRKC2]|uniref:GntP family permease n=1 Tax=Methanolobus sp. ZRKC2 TaxID=3125783 RepID=UPI003254E5E0
MDPLIIFSVALVLILILTARLRIHPFLSLILVSVFVGLLIGDLERTLVAISQGMGRVFGQFAIVITAGSIIGLILHRTGGTTLIADDIIKISKRPLLALNILGFVFAVPLMCCILAYVIFIPVAKDLSARLGISRAVSATALGLGTLASFNLVYPSPVVHPAMIELDILRPEVIVTGLAIAIIVSLIGYWYAVKFCDFGENTSYSSEEVDLNKEEQEKVLPGRVASYSPLVIPIILILLDVFTAIPLFDLIGDPDVALLIGVILAILLTVRTFDFSEVRAWIEKGIRRSGIVLLDMCGGGALGATLALTGAGEALGDLLISTSMPALLIPFLVTAAIQTVQGSRVVTMLVAPSLIIPVLPELGLPAEIVLFSMASGTLLISHFNDPFFWIFGDLAEMETTEILRTYTAGGIIMGISSLALTGLIYLVFY